MDTVRRSTTRCLPIRFFGLGTNPDRTRQFRQAADDVERHLTAAGNAATADDPAAYAGQLHQALRAATTLAGITGSLVETLGAMTREADAALVARVDSAA